MVKPAARATVQRRLSPSCPIEGPQSLLKLQRVEYCLIPLLQGSTRESQGCSWVSRMLSDSPAHSSSPGRGVGEHPTAGDVPSRPQPRKPQVFQTRKGGVSCTGKCNSLWVLLSRGITIHGTQHPIPHLAHLRTRRTDGPCLTADRLRTDALGGVWPAGRGRFSFPSTLP